ncbi:sn-glycerol-3-phosphate ABC transporter ATP-binding protein UgpC [Halobacillus kuroshimensis]|uniref:Sn-glycerol-3-phosphate ABC transporter ATP-binding protein UgpC n=1 Tax=Halobacillus kuroshimensis TaxID=302481 RepID=A0ABS3DWV3_9BACI|nr:sn-glycerol-3-phosphate ABC transporter ATP-binding protein UgpC [Halobacillus kuroshimensis]MBN8235816.1 sn-glycerol-3-phosphate ABC transporter ATP-binding protein UgpC [Halobacillus kuroshimensis]
MKQVKLDGLYKTYDGTTPVLSNVNATIEAGEFFVLVGPSGCGKSTLLRMIAGLEETNGGAITIGNKRADQLMPSERDLSMVFQNYALYPHLTVFDNIVFGLHVKKVPKEERKRRGRETAEMLGLTDYLKRKPRQLSGGQRQRVALARAIVDESPVCLMDEPLSNLDAKLRAHMRAEIKQIQRRLGLTIIYVTHDQVEAMTMGDRIMVLNKGVTQQIGTPLEIYNQPANPFVATFIGSPPMNIAEGEIKDHKLFIEGLGPIPLPNGGAIDQTHVYAGIRPEAVRFVHDPVREKGPGLIEVKNVEVLGNETVLMFTAAGRDWYARWSGQWPVKPGDRIPVMIDYADVALFDKASEKSIKHGQSPDVAAEISREEVLL